MGWRSFFFLLVVLVLTHADQNIADEAVEFFKSRHNDAKSRRTASAEDSNLTNSSQSLSNITAGAPGRTTDDLTRASVKKRTLLFGSIFGLGGAALLAAAVYASSKKNRKMEIPLPSVSLKQPPWKLVHLTWGAVGIAAGFLLLYMHQSFGVSPDYLIGVCTIGLGFLVFAFTLYKLIAISTNVVDIAEIGREGRYGRINGDAAVENAETQQDGTQGATEDNPEAGRGDQAAYQEFKDKKKAGDYQKLLETRQLEIEAKKRFRKIVLALLLVAYVALCTVLPRMLQKDVSCRRGFYWEDHIPFFTLFFITKAAELYFYTSDTTVEGRLPFWKFMMMFTASFFGYGDGYQDSVSIEIAGACGRDLSEKHHELASKLHETMSISFWVGVVGSQWFVLGVLSLFKDPSLATLAKIVHMDALAASTTVESEDMWLWWTVNLARLVTEDVPQAGQQVLFVIYVKENLFMVVSILFSVMSSAKALYDACKRVAKAVGYEDAVEEALQEQEQEARRVFVVGGFSGSRPQSSLQILDQTAEELRWELGAPMKEPRGLAGAAIGDGNIYVMGGSQNYYGSTPLGDMEIYDISAGTWRSGPPMQTPRFYHKALFISGTVWVIGGHTAESKRNKGVATVDIFNIQRDSWGSGPELPVPMTRFGAAVIENRYIFVVGGSSAHQSGSDTNRVFGLDTSKPEGEWNWEDWPEMPTSREALGVGCANGIIYAAGGSNRNTEGMKTVEIYDPMNGQWVQGPDMQRGREHVGVAAMGSKVFAIGGYQNERVVEIFDTSAFAWKNGPDLKQGVWGPAIVVD